MMNTKILLKTISSNRSVFFSNRHNLAIVRIAIKFTQRKNQKKRTFIFTLNYWLVENFSVIVKNSPTKNFLCQTCNKAFIDNYKLKRHEKTHDKTEHLMKSTSGAEIKSTNLNFSCKICFKSFSDNWKLNRHEKVHNKSWEL